MVRPLALIGVGKIAAQIWKDSRSALLLEQTIKGDPKGITYDELCGVQKGTDTKGKKVDEKDCCSVALFVGDPNVLPLEKGRSEQT